MAPDKISLFPNILTKIINKPLIGSITLFIFAFALTQIIYFLLPASSRINESLDYNLFYYVIAERLSAGQPFDTAFWFSSLTDQAKPVARSMQGEFVTHYPPGMPVLLSFLIKLAENFGLGPKPLIHFVFDVLYALSASIFFLFALQLTSSKYALLGGLVWASYPLNLWLTKQPNSEIPFLFFFLLSLLSLMRACNSNSLRWAFITSVSLGLAINFRAAGILLPIVFCIILKLYDSGIKLQISSTLTLKAIAILVFVPYLLITPWEIKMYQNTGRFIPVASSAEDMSQNMDKFFLTPGPDKKLIISNALRHNILDRNCGTTKEKFYKKICIIHNKNMAFNDKSAIANLEFYWHRFTRPFYGTFTKRHEMKVLTLNAFYLILIILGCWFAKPEKRRQLSFMCVPIFLYFFSLSLVVIPVTRYMVPAFGILFIFIPYCLDVFTSKKRLFW